MAARSRAKSGNAAKSSRIRTVSDQAIPNNKIAYVSEDRKKYGIVQLLNIKENITLANLQEDHPACGHQR